MPIHTFECFSCSDREDKFVTSLENIPCLKCGGIKRIVYDWGSASNAFCDFKPFDADIDLSPVRITSRRQWQEECSKRNLTSHYLENGYNTYKRSQKWI